MTDASNRRALIVRGGWDGHSPVEATDSFVPFLHGSGFEVRIEESPEIYADADAMAGFDLIVQTVTMSTISRDQLHGLIAAVTAGAGYAGWHGGIADSYRNESDYLQFVGGQFATHPPKAPKETLPGEASDNFVEYTVNIVPEQRDHPIVAGIDDFSLTTEQYWVLSDDLNDVLATTTLPARDFDPWHRPVTCPAIWTRLWGEGRIFVATPGHDLQTLDTPPVRTIIERGLLWASR